MNKKFYKKPRKIISLLLASVISLSVGSISGNANDYQETDSSLTGNIKDKNYQEETKKETYINDEYITNVNEKEFAMYGASSLPSKVDNSANKYFPPIASQGGIGSCASWATAYYTLSYTYNKSRDRTATYENSFSPRFLFNFSNNNMSQGGTPFIYLADFLKKIGCVTNEEFPYNGDYSIWPTNEEAYKSAAKHKVKKFEVLENVGIDGKIITSTDDDDILAIKTALSNGDVLPFKTYFNSFNYSKLKSNNSGYNNGVVGEEVVISCDGQEGDHEMTIVGYDDSIWSDINNNNVIDRGEMGAFKIANSHGPDYCNKGFVWAAYDALNKKSVVDKVISAEKRIQMFTDVGRLEVMPESYVPHKFVKVTTSTKDRYHTNVKIKGTWEDKTFEQKKIIPWTNWGFDTVGYDGSNNETEGTFAFDLGYIMDPIGCTDINEVDWEIEVYSSQGGNKNSITLKDCVIYDDQSGTTLRNDSEFPVTACGDSKTINFHNGVEGNNAIVYYRGYKNPVISYKINNSYTEINKPMEYDTDMYGYVNRIVIPLGTASQATIRFGNGSGVWDDNNGNGYRAVKGKNYFITENVGEPIDFELSNLLTGTSDVGVEDSYTVKYISGYEPLKYKYVIKEKNTNRIEAESEYKEPDANTNLLDQYVYEKEGNYEISVFAMDSSGGIRKKSIDVEIKDEPLTFTDFYIQDGKDDISLLRPIKLIAKTKNNNMEPNNCGYKLDIMYFNKVVFSKKVSFIIDKTIVWRNPKLKTCQYYIEWVPPASGGYCAIISRIDANGEYSYKTLMFNITEDTGMNLKEFKVTPENSARKGERIKAYAEVENLDDPGLTYEYSYSYIKYGQETIIQDYTASESCEFNLPDEYGPYEILVKAKSSNGEIFMESKTVWVEQVRGDV